MSKFIFFLLVLIPLNHFCQSETSFISKMKEAQNEANNNNYYSAIQKFTEATKINPNNAMPYYNRGVIKHSLGDIQGALMDYNKAITLFPDYSQAYANRGVIKSTLKNERGAIVDYDKAISINPAYSEAYFNRGISRLKLGRKNLGCQDLMKARDQGFRNAYEAVRKFCY